MTDERWLSAEQGRAWRAFLDMGNGMTAVVAQQLSEHDLSIPDYDVLTRLAAEPSGALRARELRESIRWDRSRLSHQLRRMERRDLVVRRECVDDARGTVVELTPRGRRAVRAAAPGHVATVRRFLFDELTDNDVTRLRSIAERVDLAMQDKLAE